MTNELAVLRERRVITPLHDFPDYSVSRTRGLEFKKKDFLAESYTANNKECRRLGANCEGFACCQNFGGPLRMDNLALRVAGPARRNAQQTYA